MLSKLTFSLALVLMLAFLATSAMAQAVRQLLQKGKFGLLFQRLMVLRS